MFMKNKILICVCLFVVTLNLTSCLNILPVYMQPTIEDTFKMMLAMEKYRLIHEEEQADALEYRIDKAALNYQDYIFSSGMYKQALKELAAYDNEAKQVLNLYNQIKVKIFDYNFQGTEGILPKYFIFTTKEKISGLTITIKVQKYSNPIIELDPEEVEVYLKHSMNR